MNDFVWAYCFVLFFFLRYYRDAVDVYIHSGSLFRPSVVFNVAPGINRDHKQWLFV